MKALKTEGLKQLAREMLKQIKEHMDSLARVASTGSYNDLADKPSIPDAVRVKGAKESAYHTGDVNLTPGNLGAVDAGGDTMTGDLTFPNTAGIVQKQIADPNYSAVARWEEENGGGTYPPQIGRHNTGGDGSGAVVILPYASQDKPYEGKEGLYIAKGSAALDGKELLTEENYGEYVKGFTQESETQEILARMDRADGEIQALQEADEDIRTAKADAEKMEKELANRYTKDKVYTKDEVLKKIQDLIGTAPETLDTFKEIAEALGNDPNFATTIMTALAGKVDKEGGKVLSANDYTDDEKAALADVKGKSHSHTNKSVLDKITQALVDTWNSALTALPAHKHLKSDITDMPTSMKNPSALTFTGGSTAKYDGSAEKTVEIPTKLPADGGTADYLTPHNIANSTDLNTLTKTGVYVTATSASAATFKNCPVTSSSISIIVWEKHPGATGSSQSYSQLLLAAVNSNDSRIFIRTTWNNVWSDWTELYSAKHPVPAMTGATDSAAGKAGLVPAPGKEGYNKKYLRADGGWQDPLFWDGDLLIQTGGGTKSFRFGTNGAMAMPGAQASGDGSSAEGGAKAKGIYSHGEGSGEASGSHSHAEGEGTTAKGIGSHAEGQSTTATREGCHSEGNGTQATGLASHAEGGGTTASGENSHAEGHLSEASGAYSHVEGHMNTASGNYSHAEGYNTDAVEGASHAEGYQTEAAGPNSHAEGQYTKAKGADSHAGGLGTVAGDYQTAVGKYNAENPDALFMVGNGTSDAKRSNAFVVTKDGKIICYGVLFYGQDGSLYSIAADEEGSVKVRWEDVDLDLVEIKQGGMMRFPAYAGDKRSIPFFETDGTLWWTSDIGPQELACLKGIKGEIAPRLEKLDAIINGYGYLFASNNIGTLIGSVQKSPEDTTMYEVKRYTIYAETVASSSSASYKSIGVIPPGLQVLGIRTNRTDKQTYPDAGYAYENTTQLGRYDPVTGVVAYYGSAAVYHARVELEAVDPEEPKGTVNGKVYAMLGEYVNDGFKRDINIMGTKVTVESDGVKFAAGSTAALTQNNYDTTLILDLPKDTTYPEDYRYITLILSKAPAKNMLVYVEKIRNDAKESAASDSDGNFSYRYTPPAEAATLYDPINGGDNNTTDKVLTFWPGISFASMSLFQDGYKARITIRARGSLILHSIILSTTDGTNGGGVHADGNDG